MASPDPLTTGMGNLSVDDATSQLPSRVVCKVPLKVATSGIPGAGRGIFIAEKGVEAGKLIFKISEPLLTIIENNKMLRVTCDNCLATMSNKRIEYCDPNLLFFSCKCTVTHYCSTECQSVAWDHHHQYECWTLRKIQSATLTRDDRFDHVSGKTGRCLLRLLFLHANGKISVADWAEFKSLLTKMEAKKQLPSFAETIAGANRLVDVLLRFVETLTLSREEVIELVFASWNNERDIRAPALRIIDAGPEIASRPFEKLGICLEPFVSLINHSCQPNAWLILEGKEIRIRALRDISVGEEITLNYVSELGSFEERQAKIKRTWAFDCNCTICMKGDPAPRGILGKRVFKLLETPNITSVLYLQNLERAIRDIRAAGQTLPNDQMHQLELLAFIGSLLQRKRGNALKAILALCFSTSADGLHLEERVNNFFNFLHFLEHSREQNVEELGEPVVELVSKVFFHLRAKFVKDVESHVGADTAWVKFERKEFEKALQEIKQTNPDAQPYVSLASRHKSERRQFISNMNKLLEWAELPALTKAELI